MSNSWSSYPQIYSMGHRAIRDILNYDCLIEEKVDGSQFSFGLVEANCNEFGEPVDVVHSHGLNDHTPYSLKIRSKGCVMIVEAPEKMFTLAGNTVRRLFDEGKLTPGYTYRGEYLARPKHNALAYDRVPTGNIIIFDVSIGNQEYLNYEDKAKEAVRLGLEVVPLLFQGKVGDVGKFRDFLDTASILGGQKIEGVVVKPKNYDLFGVDKKVLLGKFVSEAFKEVHRKSWGESNPTNKDIVALIVASLATQTRWNKCIQHLRDDGKLVDDVQDIGLIIREIPEDILKEEEDYIKDKLFAHAWPSIRRGVTAGFPIYYKELLLKKSFEEEDPLPPEEGS